MFPIILERDTPIIDWGSQEAWPSVETALGSNTATVKSDGVLYADFGTLYVSNKLTSITAENSVCVGIHLKGPQEGTEFTPYAISAVAMASDPVIRPYLFIGESPAVINDDATGNLVGSVHSLAWGESPGPHGSTMREETTVVVRVRTADRAFCVGVGMLASLIASGAERTMVRLSVRRLIMNAPRVIDTRKL